MIDVLKKLAAVVVVLAACTFDGVAVSPSSNTLWNITNGKGGTNDLVQVDKSGNIKADGSLTATGVVASGSSSLGILAVSGKTTLSATAGNVLLGTNVGVSLTWSVDTNKIKIVNGIITAVNAPNL